MKRIRNEQHKQSQKDWYQKNKAHRNSKQNQDRIEKKRWIAEDILAGKSCIKCNENHVGCLDFHHRDPSEKEMDVKQMVHRNHSKTKILQEIAKCDILCANCHRKFHWQENRV